MFKISFPFVVRALCLKWLILVIFLYPLSCDRFNKVHFGCDNLSKHRGPSEAGYRGSMSAGVRTCYLLAAQRMDNQGPSLSSSSELPGVSENG